MDRARHPWPPEVLTTRNARRTPAAPVRGGAFDSRLVARERRDSARCARHRHPGRRSVLAGRTSWWCPVGMGHPIRRRGMGRGRRAVTAGTARQRGHRRRGDGVGVHRALLLAHAGVIAHAERDPHAARADLAATGAIVVHDRVVDDGDLLSCGGSPSPRPSHCGWLSASRRRVGRRRSPQH